MIIAGVLLLGLGVLRLLLEGAWRSPRPAALLGYGALVMGTLLLFAGLG